MIRLSVGLDALYLSRHLLAEKFIVALRFGLLGPRRLGATCIMMPSGAQRSHGATYTSDALGALMLVTRMHHLVDEQS